METILDKFLALDKAFVLDVLSHSLQVKDFWKGLDLGIKLRRGRGYEEFEQKFGINLLETTKENFRLKKLQDKREQFDLDRICKNPKCQKHFTWNDHPYSEFCSKSCATSYSGSCANPKNISFGTKNANKRLHVIQCSKCKKDLKVSLCVTKKLCDDCLSFTGKCCICGKDFITKNRRRKTCCKEHEKVLRAKSFSDNQKITHSCGGYRKGAGHGKKGWYKGYWCDSSWELAWVIYNLDHGIKFERCKEKFEYEFEGKKHNYYPDFKLEDGTYIEIKGYQYPNWKAKREQISIPLKIFYQEDIQKIVNYVKNKYGSNWIELYDNSKPQKDISKQTQIWIHKDGKNTWIHPNKLKEYQQNGWILGRICKK